MYDTGIVAAVGSRHVEVDDLGPGDWWIAHEFPERPPDEWTVWDWGCERCFIHMTAASQREPDWPGQEISFDGGVKIEGLTMRETFEMAAKWRQERSDAL